MGGKTIGKSLNFGKAGNYARQPDMVIGSFCVDEDSRDIMFGEPVILTEEGKITAFENEGTEELFVGVATSEIKTIFDYRSMDGLYSPKQMASVMTRGAISVLCNVGEPSIAKPVYIRIKENPSIPQGKLGGFEAEADGSNTVKINNCVWRTGKDSNSIAEMLMKNINLV